MKIKTTTIAIFLTIILLFLLLVYTRFVGLDWGLPYPMHPDERNMVISIIQLRCDDISTIECFHPHFFAYGQFPLYIAFGIGHIIRLITKSPVLTPEHATLALRIISALASVITAIYLTKILSILHKRLYAFLLVTCILIYIFVPGFIQFAHFGTTESLLMMFYTILLYLSFLLIKKEIRMHRYVLISGLMLGLAMGTKISGIVFATLPFITLIYYIFIHDEDKKFLKAMFGGIQLGAIGMIFFILSSPYNLIAWSDFRGAIDYESSVGLGTYVAFYTRQFEYTIPFLFQIVRVFPHALGGPLFILFVSSFFLLPYNKEYNFLRLQFLLFFIPNAYIFAKWTRFISPIFPLMVLMATLFFVHILNKKFDSFTMYFSSFIGICITILTIVQGVAYLAIYQQPDVRFVASQWVYEHIPTGSTILSETANVVDIPIPNQFLQPTEYEDKYYTYISFNSYDVDNDEQLQEEFENNLTKADYIFIPSRRVFGNHTCYRPMRRGMIKVSSYLGYEAFYCERLAKRYPFLNNYYDDLFNNKLVFEKVAEFSSFPRIELFGLELFVLPDESAEETWTVFDHPVIRIYKRSP